MLFVIGVIILLINESLIKFSARNEIVEKIYFISPIIFSMLMIDEVPPRREFIEKNAVYANIDV